MNKMLSNQIPQGGQNNKIIIKYLSWVSSLNLYICIYVMYYVHTD